MLELVVKLLYHYGFIILLGLVVLKTILFVTYKTRNWKVHHLLFFNKQNLDSTSSERRERIKRVQNILSLMFLVVLVLTGFIISMYQD